jgi:type IV pilus assembly protein PilB
MDKDIILSIKDELAEASKDFNLIDSNEYKKISQHAKNTDGSLYDLIEKDGHVTNEMLLEAFSKKYGVSISFDAKSIKPEYKNFPYKFCEKNGLTPIGYDNVTIAVGICVPSSLNSIKNLSLLTGKKVTAKFVLAKVFVDFLIEHNPESPAEKKPSPLKAELKDEIKKSDQNHIIKSNIDIKKTEVISPEIIEKPKTEKKQPSLSGNVISGVDEIVSNAIHSGVSDVHFEIFKDIAHVRFRKNGTLSIINEYSKFIQDNYNAVIARIKILANLDIAERRLPQDGKISYKSNKGIEVDFRISILPTNLGERVVIRILNTSSLALSIDKLGFNKKQEGDFLKAIDAPQGLILVTGPTGSGKSTTLYGAINYLNKPGVNILTAEDPIEYTLSGISQVQVREDIGLTFSSALRSFLRQDPEIILVGEIRDTETADIATKAALTGHLVLSTLHTNSAIGAINRLINMGLPPYLVSSALSLVVAQRLIRVNCIHCCEDIELDLSAHMELLKVFSGARKIKAKQGKGCAECSHTGYFGRKAVHEVLSITPQLQQAISEQKNENELLDIAENQGYQTMSGVASRFIESGELSPEEYLRVIPRSEEILGED